MKPLSFMLIAGEPSGDLLAAELVRALAQSPEAAGARFFGAGGPQMSEAGVEVAFDLTQHAVVGLWEVVKNYSRFRRLFKELLTAAVARRPDVIICVDFSGFNRRFGYALRQEQRRARGGWNPRIIQYVSPQVWASRPGRAQAMARDFDLVLAIFPFEKAWYAQRAPELRVEFVGHPICERFVLPQDTLDVRPKPLVLLLPGSRAAELRRHLPVMVAAVEQIKARSPADFRLVLPNQTLADQAKTQIPGIVTSDFLNIGNLPASLAEATLAIAATGTVTLECAYFRVPTVTLYKTSWLTYEVGRRLVTVKSLTMPNLLLDEEIFPEFIQGKATPDNIARAALELLDDPERRAAIRARLASVADSLGGPGASRRAARAIFELLATDPRHPF